MNFFITKLTKLVVFAIVLVAVSIFFFFQFPPIGETHGTLINVSFSTLLQEIFLGHSSFPLSKKKQTNFSFNSIGFG